MRCGLPLSSAVARRATRCLCTNRVSAAVRVVLGVMPGDREGSPPDTINPQGVTCGPRSLLYHEQLLSPSDADLSSCLPPTFLFNMIAQRGWKFSPFQPLSLTAP